MDLEHAHDLSMQWTWACHHGIWACPEMSDDMAMELWTCARPRPEHARDPSMSPRNPGMPRTGLTTWPWNYGPAHAPKAMEPWT